MPFIMVNGLPLVETEPLLKLHDKIADALAKAADVPVEWCHPHFPADKLDGKKDPGMIYARIDTSLFDGEEADEKAQAATKAVAQVLWDAFEGKYAVEVFPLQLNSQTRTLIKAKS